MSVCGLLSLAGFEEQDAREIITIMAKKQYKDFFIDHMMTEELGLSVPDSSFSPAKSGLVMFCAMLAFGSIPGWPYVVYYALDWQDPTKQFGIACGFTGLALFLLGVVQGRFTDANKMWSGLLMLMQGALTAGAAYFVGWGLNEALNVAGECKKPSALLL